MNKYTLMAELRLIPNGPVKINTMCFEVTGVFEDLVVSEDGVPQGIWMETGTPERVFIPWTSIVFIIPG